MKINRINIPKATSHDDGLDVIKMDKLNNVILIAGKNGSGKTRILEKIFNTLKQKPTKSQVEQLYQRLETQKNNLKVLEERVAKYKVQLISSSSEVYTAGFNKNIEAAEKSMDDSRKDIETIMLQINWTPIETSEIKETYSAIQFVPKNLSLIDPNSFTKNQIVGVADAINAVGIDQLPNGTFAKIQVIQDRWFNVTHQNSKVSGEEKKIAIDAYQKLEKIIEIFLNTSVGRTVDDEATLFGFPLGKSKLSDGQKILLQFCLAVYSQEVALKDLILILDEPENHLHPCIIIETIERIRECVPNGQIWIATHSVPLLAHFDPSLIWFVEKGKITHAGKVPEKVLHSLLGDENEVAKLQDFISLPAQFATSRYAFESLFKPGVVITDSNDPQSGQIRKDLLKLTTTGKLRILDYGAGKGRLISNVVDLDESNHEKLIENIDYIAYDKFQIDKDQCESALTRAYGTCDKRYFNDFNELLSIYDKGSFDVVIMCNVLHEIDPKDWLKLFQNDGIISGLLSDAGILLLVEDHQIPIGEKAYQNGFLVLDTQQLKYLFKISEKDADFTFSDRRGDGRLKAHQVPKKCLIRVDAESRIAAIKSMSATAREKILEIRGKEKNYHYGKLHGFWTQQFANAQLNLSELTTI